MKRILMLIVVVALAALGLTIAEAQRKGMPEKPFITIRTENYPRPPYSGATYYIYETGGEVICTKLRVCNKYDQCETQYWKGIHKEDEDIETGEPYGKTAPVFIANSKLKKHVCLTRFSLLPK